MIYRFADVSIDEERDEIRRDGEVVPAQKKVRDLLLYLIRRRERLVSKEELFEALWPGVVVNEAALSQALYGARRAVGDDARTGRVLRTVRGRGVRFVAPVEELEAGAEPAAGPPEAPLAAGETPFVGRDSLLEELGGALRAASAGEGGVFLMAGEPGIGKTRAAEEFAAVARARGASVHLGRCHEAPGAPAFWPWVQLLRSLAREREAGELATLLGDGAEEVAQIAPDLLPERRGDAARERARDRETVLDPGPARFRLFDAVTQLWRRAAADRPVVLVVDDLHRADPPSWRLLHFLARELREARILVVGTYRDADAHRDTETADLLAELARQPAVHSVQLGGLEREAVSVLLTAVLGQDPAATLVSDLTERAGGNPFFLKQLATLVSEAGNAHYAPASGDMPLPRSLREAITRQLAGLPEPTRKLLNAASVAGRSFSPTLLGRALGWGQQYILQSIDPAVSAHIVFRDRERFGHFRFSHILVRNALYDSLAEVHRAALHSRIGLALERQARAISQEDFAELAYHFREASSLTGVEKAVEYLILAAEGSNSRLAYEEAAAHYRTALDLIELHGTFSDKRRCDVLMGYGEALTRAGSRHEAKQAFAKAAALADQRGAQEQLARVALRVAPGFFAIETGVHDPFIVSLLENSLRSLPVDRTALRARVLARLAMALYWSDQAARCHHLANEAESIAREVDDPYTTAYVHIALQAALWSPNTFDRRLDAGPTLIKLSQRAKDSELSLMARVFHVTTLLEAGDGYKLDRQLQYFSAETKAWRGRQPEWYARLFATMRAIATGRLLEAEELAEDLLSTGQAFSDANVLHSYAAITATIRWLQCRTDEILPAVDRFATEHPNIPGWRCALAMFHGEAGNRDVARQILTQVRDDHCMDRPKDMNWLAGIGFLGDTAATLEDPSTARWIYEALAPYTGRHVVAGFGVVPFGPVDRVLGRLSAVLDRIGEAVALFERALGQSREARCELWAAICLVDWMRALVAAGRHVEAQDIAADAQRAANAINVPRVDERLSAGKVDRSDGYGPRRVQGVEGER